jgi:hypothetical protein
MLFGLLALPFLIGSVGFLVLRQTVTWKEYLAYTAISIAFSVAGYLLALNHAVDDIEHINGRVAQKVRARVDCCHCKTTCHRRNKLLKCESSSTKCDHSSDHAYRLEIDTGTEKPYVLTLTECADTPPSAWTSAREGEPAAFEHHYKNHLKADPYSLLREGLETPAELVELSARVPERPRLHDLYKLNNVIGVDVTLPPTWPQALAELNAELGPTKQVDIIVIVVNEPDPRFAEALRAAWVYGPKNAVTIILGAGRDGPEAEVNEDDESAAPGERAPLSWRDGEIAWIHVVSLSDVSLIENDLRAQLKGARLGDSSILGKIKDSVASRYERTPMATLRYLASAVKPTPLMTALLYLANLLVISGLLWVAHRSDPLGEGPSLLRERVSQRLRQFWPWRVLVFTVELAYELLLLGVKVVVGLFRVLRWLVRGGDANNTKQ